MSCMMASLRILSLNVRGLQDVNKRRAIFNFYRDRADIMCFQETHSTVKDEIIWRNEWGGTIVFSHGTSQARGVVILFKKAHVC